MQTLTFIDELTEMQKEVIREHGEEYSRGELSVLLGIPEQVIKKFQESINKPIPQPYIFNNKHFRL